MVNGGLIQRKANIDAVQNRYSARTSETAVKKMARMKLRSGDLRLPEDREVVERFLSVERFPAIPNNFARQR